MNLGLFSCLDVIYVFLFTRFRTIPGYVPGLPTIVAVSPERAGIAFSCQGNSLTGFLLM